MNLVAWKTVHSRENRPDEFYISFAKESQEDKKYNFLFNCSEKEAKEAFGDEIDRIAGLGVVHPITFTLTIKENEG